jgi:hypothetical protein
VVYTTPGGRKQLRLHVARAEGVVRKLRIKSVPTTGDLTKLETVLELDRNQAMRLIETLRAIDSIPIEGENTVYVDDQLLQDFFSDPTPLPTCTRLTLTGSARLSRATLKPTTSSRFNTAEASLPGCANGLRT